MAQAHTLTSFGWPGRDRRLALADTIAIVRDGEVDLLCEDAQLKQWLEAERAWLGTVSPDDAPPLAALHELRQAIRTLLFACAAGKALPPAAVAVVNRYSAAGAWFRQIDLSQPGGPCVVYGGISDNRASQVLAAIADAAIELLTGADRDRIRICAAPSCGMFYVETKRGQQWCSSSCGNRARVARHYERSRTSAPEPGSPR